MYIEVKFLSVSYYTQERVTGSADENLSFHQDGESRGLGVPLRVWSWEKVKSGLNPKYRHHDAKLLSTSFHYSHYI
jgi:hypothetical protein